MSDKTNRMIGYDFHKHDFAERTATGAYLCVDDCEACKMERLWAAAPRMRARAALALADGEVRDE